MNEKLTMSAADWLLLVGLSVLWGGSFFFAKVAVEDLPPLTLACGRVAVAAAILAVPMMVRGESFVPLARAWPAFLVLGLLNCAIPFSLLFWGQTHISSSLASILNATTPIFTVLVAQVAAPDEKLTFARRRARFRASVRHADYGFAALAARFARQRGAKLVGLIAGLLGVAVMLGADALAGIGTDIWAQLACLAAAISYAFAAVYGRRLAALPAGSVATGQLIAAAIVLAPSAAFVDRPWTTARPSWAAVGALLGLAALSTALAYVIYFRLLARAGATNLSLVTFLIPVSAMLLGTIVLGERLAPHHVAGMAVIALSLAAIDGRPAQILARALRLEKTG
jgi:drug/metabolite transporter (DMT)-like permease